MWFVGVLIMLLVCSPAQEVHPQMSQKCVTMDLDFREEMMKIKCELAKTKERLRLLEGKPITKEM